MKKNYLYGLTVQGIQSYIFATNKLKEIIGASELVENVCTALFNEFLKNKKICGTSFLQAAGNIRFSFNSCKSSAEKVLEDFGTIVNNKAPGLPFSHALVIIKNNDIETARKELENILKADRNRSFNTVPLGTMFRSKLRRTGDFALNKEIKNYNDKYLDEITLAKYSNSEGTLLKNKINEKYTNFPTEFSKIAAGGKHSWLAVVHIDGNGMGNTIQEIMNNNSIDDKYDALKNFSINVENATKEAFKKSIEVVFKTKEDETIPIRPLILGGDDVTVILRADYALNFVKTYLKKFEECTKRLLNNYKTGLTACAGIAYVKEKFPFHYSVNLAEELCKYAKDASKRAASCLQIHKVTDTIFETYEGVLDRELGSLRKEFEVGPFYLNDKCKKPTITTIIENSKKLNKPDAPKNNYREWLNAKFNHPLMADELLNRIKEKTPDAYKVFWSESELKNAMLYQTLLDVQNYKN